MNFIEIIKVFILGIVEGITEWLPVSSTGHMLLLDEFIQLDASSEFKNMFFIFIQLGAIFAVVLIFWKKMVPFQFKNKNRPIIKKDIFTIWFKVAFACIPGAVATIFFDDIVDSYLEGPVVIALALIFYGVVFILVENRNKNKRYKINEISQITYRYAFIIGLFQILSIIPGTSRSGSTIIGGLLVGVSRVAVAEFTFFMAVPVMLGMSFLEILDYGLNFTGNEFLLLIFGMFVAFAVSLLVIRFLMAYIRKNDFKLFGYYRIVLGIVVLLYFI
ncbi:MAG: undecaprenyl-diphosphate phosphatase [Lachnospirales bacterium]